MSGAAREAGLGLTSPGRPRGLADVQELIRAFNLDEAFASQLDAHVRPKCLELWRPVERG